MADPEKNTIWDNTYEEEVNHTDSIKSSYEQILETKSKNIFNVSSIYFPEFDCKDENITKNPNKLKLGLSLSVEEIIRSEKCIAIDKENINPQFGNAIGLIHFPPHNANETSIFLTSNRTTYFENSLEMTVPVENDIISNQPLISPMNETVNSALTNNKTTNFENTMELTTNIINKENVNPLINDVSLFKPRTNFNVNNSGKDEKINMQKTFDENNYYSLQKSKLKGKSLDNCNKSNIQSQSNMEICEDTSNTDKFEEQTKFVDILKSSDRTIYFNESEDSMKFTKVLETEEKLLSTRKSINYLNNFESDMEFTCNYSEVGEILNPESFKKFSKPRTTVQPNQFEANMELTTNLPDNVDVENSLQSRTKCYNSDNNESIMEMTGILPIKNTTISYVPSEDNLFQGNIYHNPNNNEFSNSKSETKSKNEKVGISNVMEITSNLTEVQKNQYVERGTTLLRNNNLTRKSESNMEFTCNFSAIKEKNYEFDVETKYFEHNRAEDMECTTLSDQNLIKKNFSFKKMGASESKVNITQDGLNTHQNFNFSQIDMNIKDNVSLNAEIEKKEVPLNISQGKLVDIAKDPNVDDISKNVRNLVLIEKKNNSSELDYKNNTKHNAAAEKLNIKMQNNDCANKNSFTNNYSKVLQKADKSIKENTMAPFNTSINTNIKRCFSGEKFGNISMKKRKKTDLENFKNEQSENIFCFDETKINNQLNHVPIEILQKDNTDSINKTSENNVIIDKSNLQKIVHSNSNILYSEPMKLKAEHHNLTLIPDLSAALNLQGMDGSLDLKLKQLSTPASSFINLTTMSPCIEDTQQLIYATILNPESCKILSDDNEDCFVENKQLVNSEMKEFDERSNISLKVNDNLTDKITNKTCIKDKSDHNVGVDIAERTDLKTETFVIKTDVDINKSSNVLCISDDIKSDSFSKDDITLLDSLPDCKESDLSDVYLNDENISFPKSDGILSPYNGNYTLRSQLVLKDIKEYLMHYEIEQDGNIMLLTKSLQRFNENLSTLKQSTSNLMMQKKLLNKMLPSLEKKHKQNIEENAEKLSEKIVNKIDSKSYKDDLQDKKSLYIRVSEICERCKRYWKMVKMEDSEYYFTTLFGTLAFKAHVHPDLGIVYSIKTFENLEATARPICWYELRMFQHKLKMENLISVLGVKFDLFALLDYTYMTMDKTLNFHMEYLDLEKKYGVSHHFRMDADFNVMIEVLQIDLIVWWVITIKMPLESLPPKYNVTAISKIGEKVNEEVINSIVKNTPEGLNFLRNFIENVEEYLQRIKKRIKFRRGKRN